MIQAISVLGSQNSLPPRALICVLNHIKSVSMVLDAGFDESSLSRLLPLLDRITLQQFPPVLQVPI